MTSTTAPIGSTGGNHYAPEKKEEKKKIGIAVDILQDPKNKPAKSISGRKIEKQEKTERRNTSESIKPVQDDKEQKIKEDLKKAKEYTPIDTEFKRDKEITSILRPTNKIFEKFPFNTNLQIEKILRFILIDFTKDLTDTKNLDILKDLFGNEFDNFYSQLQKFREEIKSEQDILEISLEQEMAKQQIGHEEAQFRRANQTQRLLQKQNVLLKLKTVIINKYKGILLEFMNSIAGTDSKDEKSISLMSKKAREIKKLLVDSKCKKEDIDNYLKSLSKKLTSRINLYIVFYARQQLEFNTQFLERSFFFEPLSKEISALLMDKFISKDIDRHYEHTLGGGLISYQNSKGKTIVESFNPSDSSNLVTFGTELEEWLTRAVKATGDLLFKDRDIFTNITACLQKKFPILLAKLNPQPKTDVTNPPNEPVKADLKNSAAQIWKSYADNVINLVGMWFDEKQKPIKDALLELMLPDLQQSNKDSIKTVKDIEMIINVMLCFNRVPCDDAFIRFILSSVDKALKVVTLDNLLKVSPDETESESDDSIKNVRNIVVQFFENRFDVIFTRKELKLKDWQVLQRVTISIIIPPVFDATAKLVAEVSINFKLLQPEKLKALSKNKKLELSAAVDRFNLALKAMKCPPESYLKLPNLA